MHTFSKTLAVSTCTKENSVNLMLMLLLQIHATGRFNQSSASEVEMGIPTTLPSRFTSRAIPMNPPETRFAG